MYVCIHRLRCHGIMHLNDDPKSNDDAKFQIITLHLIQRMYVRTYVHSDLYSHSAKPHGTHALWSTHKHTCKYNWIGAKCEQNWCASVPSEQSETCLLIICHCVLYTVVLIFANSFVNSPPHRKRLQRDVYCLSCSHGVLVREYT